MKLQVLGSSSKGNCYILSNDKETLIIECGITFNSIKKALNYDISNIVGAIISHEHGDHSKYIGTLIKSGINVYAHKTVFEKKNIVNSLANDITNLIPFEVGNFHITPMEVIHDKTVVCFAFVIKHKDLGSLLFITDSLYFPTKYDKFITGCTTVMIEANYSDELIDQNVISGKIHETQRQRVMFTHMEICNTIQVVKRLILKNPIRNIILLHLSDDNASPKLFYTMMQKAIGIPTYVANKELIIEI